MFLTKLNRSSASTEILMKCSSLATIMNQNLLVVIHETGCVNIQVLKPCVLNEIETDDFQPMLNSALGIFAEEIFIKGIFTGRNFRRTEFSQS